MTKIQLFLDCSSGGQPNLNHLNGGQKPRPDLKTDVVFICQGKLLSDAE
jgi:hypothetical protein